MSVSSRRALLYRGWPAEADEIVKTLTSIGIATELVDTSIPAIIGGHLAVCEVFVQGMDLAAAERAVAPILKASRSI